MWHCHDSNRKIALDKYCALRRFVIIILDNVKNNKELRGAIVTLGWNNDEMN